MSKNNTALVIAQRFIQAVETKDRNTIIELLGDKVKQIFPMSGGGQEGVLAIFDGKEEVLQYTDGLFEKFSALTWENPVWTGSEDGNAAFLQARGNAIVAHSNAPYRNTYVVRFDVLYGRIVQIEEYAVAEQYMALGIEPRPVEIRAVERAMELAK